MDSFNKCVEDFAARLTVTESVVENLLNNPESDVPKAAGSATILRNQLLLMRAVVLIFDELTRISEFTGRLGPIEEKLACMDQRLDQVTFQVTNVL